MLSQFPKSIAAGLSLRAELYLPEYLAPDWSLVALLRGPSVVDLAATAQGTAHLFALDGAATSSYLPGDYSVSVRAISGSDVFEVESGILAVVVDLGLAVAGHESRTHAVKVLASVEAVIEGRATRDQESYSINGRTLTRTPIADLLLLRDRYRKEVGSERRGGRPKPLLRRKINVRFGR